MKPRHCYHDSCYAVACEKDGVTCAFVVVCRACAKLRSYSGNHPDARFALWFNWERQATLARAKYGNASMRIIAGPMRETEAIKAGDAAIVEYQKQNDPTRLDAIGS